MTIDDLLSAPAWTCQWRCPYLGEVNTIGKQEFPAEIASPADLLRHLVCRGCQMDLGDILLIQFVVHSTRPARIPQKKQFAIHCWPETPSASSRT